jgi:hypothetical protein
MFQPRFLSVETTERRVAKRHAAAKGAGDFSPSPSCRSRSASLLVKGTAKS